jgi:hypothetical protein
MSSRSIFTGPPLLLSKSALLCLAERNHQGEDTIRLSAMLAQAIAYHTNLCTDPVP